MHPFIIGISGPSTSGKSTVSKELKKNLKGAVIMHLDNYWKDHHKFPKKYGYRNWELPRNLKFDLLEKNLKDLRKGKQTKAPIYENYQYFKGYKILKPHPIIIIEGFLLFYYKKIRDLLNLKIYLDISDNEIVRRRLMRSRSSKGSEKELYYRKIVVNEYKRYGKPYKKYANIILDGKKDTKIISNKILREVKPL